MPDRKHDELADALARMNAGEELPEAIDLEADAIPPLDFPPPPPTPTVVPPPSVTPPRPAIPRPTPRPSNPAPASTPAKSKPAPSVPSGPRIPVPPTPSRSISKSSSHRPSLPPRPAGPPSPGSSADQSASPLPVTNHVASDPPDDIGFSAAPSLSEYSPRPSSTPYTPLHKSLFLRRTLIPILLTLGIGLPAIMSIRFFVDEDSPFAALQFSYTLAAYVAGAVLLLLAILNMLHVRAELADRKK